MGANRSNISIYYATSDRLSNNGREYLVDAPIFMEIDPETFQMRVLSNKVLEQYLLNNPTKDQKIPTFTIDQAIETAKRYLKQLDIDLPANCVIGEVNFDQNYNSRWEIRWKLSAGQYTYEEFNRAYAESVVIVFHETLGLSVYGLKIVTPPPKSLVVKVGRDDAIIKASKCAPDVFRTVFYRQARESGFVLSGLKDVQLQVIVPNWMLDPAKSNVLRKGPPTESRLCWAISFSTVDSQADHRNLKLHPPDIIIYLDAATGECVGADFT